MDQTKVPSCTPEVPLGQDGTTFLPLEKEVGAVNDKVFPFVHEQGGAGTGPTSVVPLPKPMALNQSLPSNVSDYVQDHDDDDDSFVSIPFGGEVTTNSNITSGCHAQAGHGGNLSSKHVRDVSPTRQTSMPKITFGALAEKKKKTPDQHNEQERGGDVNEEGTDADLTSLSIVDHHINREKPRRMRCISHTRQASSTKIFGGFGEMNETVKLYQSIRATIKDGNYEKLDKLYTGTSQVTTMEENQIKYAARAKSLRQSLALTYFFLVVYFVAGGAILIDFGRVSSIQHALLYTVYSMTSTGFGSIKVPLTSPGFLVFLIIFMFVGVALVVLVAAQMYIWLSMEASNIKRYLDKKRMQHQGATTTRTTQDKSKNAVSRFLHKLGWILIQCAGYMERNYRKSECFRLSVVVGYLLSLLLIATGVEMHFEGWTFIEALYFATYCMTTMGYGDIAPKTSGGVWFIIFWLPLNVSFISIYMGNLAYYYMKLSTAFSERVYNRLMDKRKGSTSDDVQALSDRVAHISGLIPSPHSAAESSSLHTMRDLVELVLETFSYQQHDNDDDNDEVSPVQKFLHLKSPWTSSGAFHDNKVRKPSFALQVLMQERLISLFVEDVVGMRTSLYEKDLTFVVTFDTLQDIAEKWMIPTGARDAFSMIALEAMIYIGEKRLVIEGGDAFLDMSPMECHKLFSPLLAAFEDAGTMEGWLAATEELAASYLNCDPMFALEVPRRRDKNAPEQDFNEKTMDANIKCSPLPNNGKISRCDNEQDLAMLAKLSTEYDRSMEEIQTMYLSQSQANRTMAFCAVMFFLCYEALVTTFVTYRAHLTASQGMLYTAYTITSAGFGNVPTPKTDSFLFFAVVNIFISISSLAIMVAQAFIYLQSVAIKKEHTRDKILVAARGQEVLTRLCAVSKDRQTVRDVLRVELSKALQMVPGSSSKAGPLSRRARLSNFLLGTELGRSISVAITLLSLWFMGAFAMMGFEGWTLIQGLYYATYALLTVGHGDLTPITRGGTWFTVFWLPFNVLFVTLYLGSVAHIFVRLSRKNTNRIERRMKRERKSSSQPSDDKVEAVHDKDDTNNANANAEIITNNKEIQHRRARIKQKSTGRLFGSDGTEIVTARDLLSKVVYNEPTSDHKAGNNFPVSYTAISEEKEAVNLSSSDRALLQNDMADEKFALRLRVLDRVARVISAQLMDFEAAVEVDGNTLRVTVGSVRDWISLWEIPYGARNIYRLLSFECLLFVGEKQIFAKGDGAFFDLSILEFIELFSPFVFAMKDTETMQEWLVKTDHLANEVLHEKLDGTFQPEIVVLGEGRRFLKNTIENYFPPNPGNVIRIQLQ